ncbi:hypothetical protein [Allonocardiopsis opalescens]|uniref:Uncharacterized protein n=1 Tax=Allonocardiopsis opalescens TaxID=1144618 RepID=A0A2T0Q3R8_9ACTN|nr:hypothetical protein [Allonocardiopsis opalescens]PRX98449.1 hypothetical protein CLV72_10426 [Allonocardiopsis opalescens]
MSPGTIVLITFALVVVAALILLFAMHQVRVINRPDERTRERARAREAERREAEEREARGEGER